MNRKNKLVLILCLISQCIWAQINEGGKPTSFYLDISTRGIPVLEMLAVNTDSIKKENEKIYRNNFMEPFKYGYAIEVDIDIKKEGILTLLPNGDKLWLLKIHSRNAYTINLIYNRFWLAKGSKFFIYNEDRTMILGAFTPETSNNPQNQFATELLQGDTVVLEYYEPSSSDGGIINIGKVIHGYIKMFSRGGYGQSDICNIGVNCPLGDNWENEKRAVCLIIRDDGSTCTGCLINNTEQDLTPYILTANHAFYIGSMPITNPATCIFRFRYWEPNCSSGNPTSGVSITGATIVAQSAEVDFALLKLNSIPPANYQLFYAGWDRTEIPAQNGTTIHHPQGDVMKISHDEHPISAMNYGIWGLNYIWGVNFDKGIVQPGSSGAPLFNQDKRIVGQLTGTFHFPCDDFPITPCVCNLDSVIFDYTRFDYSWFKIVMLDSALHLNPWLAPGLVNPPLTLNGMSHTSIVGKEEVCYYGRTFTLNPSTSINIYWTVSDTNIFSVNPVTGTSTTVTRIGTGMGTDNYTLIARVGSATGAIVDSISITPCPPTSISGPDDVYSNGGVFTLTNPPSNTIYWTVTGPFSFSSSSVVTSTTGNPKTVYRRSDAVGTTGTLTTHSSTSQLIATKDIQCPDITGPETICHTTSATYSLPSGLTATWSVSPGFSITETNGGASAIVTPAYTSNNPLSGTITALIDNNNNMQIKKSIQACQLVKIETELRLSSFIDGVAYNGKSLSDLEATFIAETYMPGSNKSEHEIIRGHFMDNDLTGELTTTDVFPDVFNEAVFIIDASAYTDLYFSYCLWADVYDMHIYPNPPIVYTNYWWGVSNSSITEIVMLLTASWNHYLSPSDNYMMQVTCEIGEAPSPKSMHDGSIDGASNFENSFVRKQTPSNWEVMVYPNPTNGLVQVDIAGDNDIPQGAMIEIFAERGTKVGRWTGISYSNICDISAQPIGSYLVRVYLDKENIVLTKIIKN